MQGTCRYILTENRDPIITGVPHFVVYNKNEHRNNNTDVAYPSYVEVHVYDHVIRLGRHLVVTVSIFQANTKPQSWFIVGPASQTVVKH